MAPCKRRFFTSDDAQKWPVCVMTLLISEDNVVGDSLVELIALWNLQDRGSVMFCVNLEENWTGAGELYEGQ